MPTFSRREFAIGALCAAAGSAVTLGRPASGATAPSVDAMSLVDPALRAELLRLQPALDKESYNADTLREMRRLANDWAEPPDPTPTFTMRAISSSAGQPAVNVYVINQKEAHGRPAILHIHGGGYIVGRALDGVKRLQAIAAQHDCLVVTVDYRLAPEAKFPASLEDNYAALRWLCRQAEDLGVDRNRIAVMGESAGGGHAAALAIAARDRGEIHLCQQVLVYPMLDDRTGSTVQPELWMGAFIWKRASNEFGWSSLLGIPAGSAQMPYGAVPARVANLAGLPPAFIGVGSIDLFADEDLKYASRLMESGVATELYMVAGGYHGFNEIVPAAPTSVLFEKVLNAAIARGFAR